MANAVFFDFYTEHACAVALPANRRPFSISGLILLQRQSLPTDAIGVFVLTLTNVVVGSRIHIEKQDDRTQIYDVVAENSTVVINIDAYAANSAYNDLRIKVRKGTGTPSYKPFETLATAIVGSQSIYVGQIADE